MGVYRGFSSLAGCFTGFDNQRCTGLKRLATWLHAYGELQASLAGLSGT